MGGGEIVFVLTCPHPHTSAYAMSYVCVCLVKMVVGWEAVRTTTIFTMHTHTYDIAYADVCGWGQVRIKTIFTKKPLR